MKNNKHKKIYEHTPKKLKQYAIIWFITSILFIISGISSFAENIANAFLLIGLGIIFFVISRRYFKIAKEKAEREYRELKEKEKAEQEYFQELERKEKIEKERLETERKNREKFIRENDTKTYRVAGVTYYEDNILSLAQENDFYEMTKKELIEDGFENERIYEYDFCVSKFEVVPEPDNPHDKNAIKVLADGVQIGHIKAGSCSHLLNVIKEDRLTKIEGEIKGGKYKYIGYDDETEKYWLEKDKIPFYAKLEITEKKKSTK